MTRRRALLLAPLGVTVVAGAGFWTVLDRMRRGTFDPRGVPSPLIGQTVPDFTLPPQDPGAGFGSTDLIGLGRPVLVNFFASWCVPCIVEHPQLMELARSGLTVWGIAYKDTAAAASGFIARHGNPFARMARDEPGQVSIDWGVYGVPESYVVDGKGVIRWRYAGPLTPDVVSDQLRPVLQRVA